MSPRLASANSYTDARIAGVAFDLKNVAKKAYAGSAAAIALQAPALFEPGQTAMLELEYGYHIVKVSKRVMAGVKPFDDQVQKEIKEKLKNDTFQFEMKQEVNRLKQRAIIEIGTEIK